MHRFQRYHEGYSPILGDEHPMGQDCLQVLAVDLVRAWRNKSGGAVFKLISAWPNFDVS
jgi:hypothetical protein